MTKRTGGDGPAKPKVAAKPRAVKPKVAAKNPGGRPTKFKPEYVDQVCKLCLLGATDADISAFFKISRQTLHTWRVTHEDLAAAMAVGKELADDRVVRSLYQKAVGYTFESEKIFCHEGVVTRAATVEHVPPSDTACIFWLKNRRRDDWRDKQEVEHTGKLTVVIGAADADL